MKLLAVTKNNNDNGEELTPKFLFEKLSDMDISPTMEKTFEKPMSDISFVDLFYSLYDMKLEELKVLSRNISSNDTMKNLVGLVIASRSKFSK